MTGRTPRKVAAFAVMAAVFLTAACESGPSPAWAGAGVAAPGGEWFVQTGCTACHTVTVYGLWTPAANAPDLSQAVIDVPKRFGRSLDDFLQAPTGTMAMVFANRIPLDTRQREVAIAQLKKAFAAYQRNNGGSPLASH